MDIKQTITDSKLEVEGREVPLDDETTLIIARYMNPKHKAFIQRKLEPYKKQMRANTLPDDIYRKIEIEGIARHVLIGWEGMHEGPKILPYDVDAAIRLLSNPGLEWLLDFVKEVSQDITLYRYQEIDEEVDNLKK